MKSIIYELHFSTTKPVQFFDITNQVKEKLKQSKIQNGIVLVFTQHTTTSIKINEKEENLETDMTKFLEKLAPTKEHYLHDETAVDGRMNAHSHMKSLILNSSETIPITNGEMILGTWQSIFFVELDGDRKRKVFVQILGE
jgi:secondary thiamine-phosphate synthase enzyme